MRMSRVTLGTVERERERERERESYTLVNKEKYIDLKWNMTGVLCLYESTG